jgi:hypothetical protein
VAEEFLGRRTPGPFFVVGGREAVSLLKLWEKMPILVSTVSSFFCPFIEASDRFTTPKLALTNRRHSLFRCDYLGSITASAKRNCARWNHQQLSQNRIDNYLFSPSAHSRISASINQPIKPKQHNKLRTNRLRLHMDIHRAQPQHYRGLSAVPYKDIPAATVGYAQCPLDLWIQKYFATAAAFQECHKH